MADEFDRIKPPDRRLLERSEATGGDAADPAGRSALFSVTGRAPARPASAGLRTHCSACGAIAALDPATAMRAALPLFLVVPWKDHPVFAVCPVCRRRRWLRVERASPP